MAEKLEQGGLSREQVRQWMNVCWPLQIQAVIDDFPQYGPADWIVIGMNGARGLKAGVRRERQLTALSDWQSQRVARERAIYDAINAASQDFTALADEFL